MAPRRPPVPRPGAGRGGPATPPESSARRRPPAAGPRAEGARPARPRAGTPSAGAKEKSAAGAAPRRPPGAGRPARPGAGASRPAGSGARAGRGARRRPMARPVTLIAGVAVVLALLLAPYIRPWLAQRSQISGQHQQLDDLRRQVDGLKQERQRWQDPTYVRAQARERLNFVMPGDTGYVLLVPQVKPAPRDPRQQAAAAASAQAGRPWYASLWASTQLAGSSGGDGR
jgi:cell division protein FtsB